MSATPLTNAQAKTLEDKYISPNTGSIARRKIRRLLNNITAVGPSGPAAKTHTPPTLAQAVEQDRRDVEDELKAIDRRVAQIDEALATPARPSMWGGQSFEMQELRSERQQLRDLRREIEADLVAPIAHDRAGRPLDVRDRMIRRQRAADLRESCWRQAEMYRAQGMHREARRWRLDALRARHLAESELGWRPSLATYW